MTTLTITAKGQITLRKDILRHLGVEPGQQVEVSELPGGRIEIKAVRPAGNIDGFIGVLAGKTDEKASIAQLNAAIARAWAAPRRRNLRIL